MGLLAASLRCQFLYKKWTVFINEVTFEGNRQSFLFKSMRVKQLNTNAMHTFHIFINKK